jgi:hypothetical protein
MRGWLISAALVLTLALSPGPAAAQEVTQSVIQEAFRVASLHQAMYARLSSISQTLPAYPEGGGDAERRQWSARSRLWVASARAVIDEVRASAAALPPVPERLPGDIRRGLLSQRERFPEIVNSFEQFVSRHSQALDAVDRGDADGAAKMLLSALDSAILTLRLMRDLNADQASFVAGDHPQSFLLRSIARSCDAMVAVFGVQRAEIAGEVGDREAAARTVTEAAADMRRLAGGGRRAATTMTAGTAAQQSQNSEESRFQERVMVAFRTYPASFDRELEIATLLDGAVGLLRDSRPHEATAPEFDALNLRFATLDEARATDIQRRAAIIQGQ